LCTFDQFKTLSHAYEILSNPRSREVYDLSRQPVLDDPGECYEKYSPSDINDEINLYEHFFGKFPLRTKIRQLKTPDRKYELKVSLNDLYSGTVNHLTVERNVICETCMGESRILLDEFKILKLNIAGSICLKSSSGNDSVSA